MSRSGPSETSLDAAMRAPSTHSPDIVVLDILEEDVKVPERVDPKKDLWLSTVDGRHQSAIIPIRVGPTAELFSVHKAVLTKSEYFSKALNGDFKEAEEQAIDLPEEDPAIFSFVVAYLYEGKFMPIKPIASVLVAEPDKGKGKENVEGNSGSEDLSDSSAGLSDDSARSRRRRETRRRRQERVWEQRQRKEPGRHRPDCSCAVCVVVETGPPCWNCGVTRRPPPPPPRRYFNGMPPPQVRPQPPYGAPRPRNRDRRRGSRDNMAIEEPPSEERMSEEDLRTWTMAYSLSIEVYVCAERYLMHDFKACIASYIVNQFEIAGVDAAQPGVLASCKILYDGLSSLDPLLKKVFARVGFLQTRLYKHFPIETDEYLKENPEVARMILREMGERIEEDAKDDLPAMNRLVVPPPPREDVVIQGPRPRRRYDPNVYR